MAVDFAREAYLPNFNYWARPVVITPLVSNPGAPAYDARGIYDTNDMDIIGIDGNSIVSDQKTELDILEDEFLAAGIATPVAGDLISIPAVGLIRARGPFEVIDRNDSGGGEITLTIRAMVLPAP
jgi:hypothetical protein